MKLSKSKVISLAALGLAVAAMLVDRLVVGPDAAAPKSAEATIASRPAAPAAPAAPATTVPASAPIRLADRLKVLAEAPNLDPLHARDAFVPPESWLAQPKTPETAAAAPAADPAEKFIHEHKLTSVLTAGDGGIAMVNGKVLRVGQEVDGFKLVRLEPGCAVFRGGDDVDVKLKTLTEPR